MTSAWETDRVVRVGRVLGSEADVHFLFLATESQGTELKTLANLGTQGAFHIWTR